MKLSSQFPVLKTAWFGLCYKQFFLVRIRLKKSEKKLTVQKKTKKNN